MCVVLLGVEADAIEFVTDLFGRPGRDDDVAPLFVVEGIADNAAPAIDTWSLFSLHDMESLL